MEVGIPTRQTSSRDFTTRRKSNLLQRLVRTLQEDENSAKGSSTRQLQFITQNRIFGREKEILLLENAYQRIAKSHSELVLIRGPSGSGKSTLLEAFVRELPPSAFRVSGKFDQLQSHAPYAALVSASEQLCRQALRRDNRNDIRDRIRELAAWP